ncbi:MAG: hypothetical protein HY302_13710 [Opitutae bacterium]|nr:hypothetical protein [Opitutae bacterium]
MPRFLKHFLLIAAVLGLAPWAAAAERWETLQAIHWVENPTNQTRAGSFGELGPYQFRRDTWRMHTRLPFSRAIDHAQADVVAVKHYEWIKRGLAEAGIDPSPFNIALAWNCGLGAVVAGRVPGATYRYAEQVTNLVATLRERPRPPVAAPPAARAAVSFSMHPPLVPRFEIVTGGPRLVTGTGPPRYQLDD